MGSDRLKIAIALVLCSALMCYVQANPPPPLPAKSTALVLLAGHPEERLPVAVSLYRAGYAPIILLTNDGVLKGWSGKHQRNLY